MASLRLHRRNQTGHAVLESALILPLLILLLLSVADFGVYVSSLMSVENAARVAVLDTSASAATASNSALACSDASGELQAQPNYSLFPSDCSRAPLLVTAQQLSGPDGSTSSRVTVTYTTVQLFKVPWTPGQLTITRAVQMRTRS